MTRVTTTDRAKALAEISVNIDEVDYIMKLKSDELLELLHKRDFLIAARSRLAREIK